MAKKGSSSAASVRHLEFVRAEMGLVAAESNDHGKRWADHPAFPVIEDVRHFTGLAFHVECLASMLGMVEHHDGCFNRHPVARLHRT